MVGAAIAITVLSYMVWLHHFFTMGGGATVNAFFSVMTHIIAIPMGVQVFNWILTMFRGRIIFATPMYWFIGFVATFVIGGMTGLLLGAAPADFQLHNSLFLIAHFHTMVVGGAIFGTFAGVTYWFPKLTGYSLNERIGRWAFWIWLLGFFVCFGPLYLLGLMGATRRLDHYSASTGWQPLYVTAFIGFLIILCGILVQVYQFIISYRERKEHRDTSGDPWNGRTLEWSTTSPPPFYNFAVIPTITSREEFWEMKKSGYKPPEHYEDIVLPKNTGMGVYVSGFAFLLGFALVWHILWLGVVGVVGIIGCIILRSLEEETEYILSAEEVEKLEAKR
jgi:cytochrome o ubiquinol oxidase subunit 1